MVKKKRKTIQKNIGRIIRRTCYFLYHHADCICFQKLPKNICGYYDGGTEEIIIDYRKDIIPTLIHELLHLWHPKLSEERIVKEEKRIVKALTPSHCKKIVKALADGF